MNDTLSRAFIYLAAVVCLAGCAALEPKPPAPSEGHIQPGPAPAEAAPEIPPLVEQAPILPEPSPPAELEKYTVVVSEVPVKELLFALARDARLNIDIHPGIEGTVTLNAVDQTLPQILDRISRQVNMRYEFADNSLVISPDAPFFRSYKINYVNMARDTTATNRVSTQISATGAFAAGGAAGGTAGGGTNTSTTDVASISNHRFWETLVLNVLAILGEEAGTAAAGQIPFSPNVIASPETGLLNVRATSAQHELIRQHIDRMLESAQRQVLIQATIVEVALSDQYQAGIDWSGLNIAETGIDIISTTLNPAFPATPFGTLTQLTLDYTDTDAEGNIRTTTLIRLLEEFGETSVLSSPQIMVLNNQTAILKVVENVVYFLIESELTPATVPGGAPVTSVDTTPQTVPVGIVMAVTPQINEADVVTLNVRPTISRVREFIPDPNPNVAPGVVNRVPQIEVREMESMLRLNSGQVAVLGGLMQDTRRDDDSRIPGFSRLPVIGDLFRTKTKDYQKSELVIFLRPMVIRNPSLAADLSDYRSFLEHGAAPYAEPKAPPMGQTPDSAGASGQ